MENKISKWRGGEKNSERMRNWRENEEMKRGKMAIE